MREIKFRAWIPDVKQLRDVIAIEFDEPDDVYTHVPIVRVWDHPSTRAAKIKGRVATFLKKDVTLMQYTGLKDKNGKEIYEGDILKYRWEWRPYPDCDDDEIQATYITQQVIFHDACFWFSGGGFENIQHFMDKPDDMEVIGNIWENPELLTPEKEKNG